ncbi:MAG: PaaI family thioesterase [Actinomycetota bacterium]|nr:PaaI family thioesterase [Actinomycetota bacterium]
MSEVQPDGDPFDRLGSAIRALSDAVVRSGADAADADDVAARVEELVARLSRTPQAPFVHDSPFHAMSIVGGTAHPIAPQLQLSRTERGVAGTTVLGAAYEGAPGLVHGGIVSLIFDHMMGQALFVTGHHAMTVQLEVRYRRPTPLGVPLTFTTELDRVAGRKLNVTGRVRTADGTTTAEAGGVFLELTAANVAQLFPAARVRPGR